MIIHGYMHDTSAHYVRWGVPATVSRYETYEVLYSSMVAYMEHAHAALTHVRQVPATLRRPRAATFSPLLDDLFPLYLLPLCTPYLCTLLPFPTLPRNRVTSDRAASK